jgi:hypothetical protein
MPYDDPDPTDPMTLHGVELETDDPEATQRMAECLVEEFVRLGLSRERVLELFTDGRFFVPALALRELGVPAIAALIDAQFQMRGPRALRVAVNHDPRGACQLPILDP